MKHLLAAIFIAGAFLGCKKQIQAPVTYNNSNPSTPPVVVVDNLTYLALGDSYTIGEAVNASQSYPYQLAAWLTQAGHNTANPTIIARTGWTTDELINAINTSGTAGKKYSIVTLLIGVNNQYRGYSKTVYRSEFAKLLSTAIDYANGNKSHVFVISIPNWGLTPYASGNDRKAIGDDIAQFNAINKDETNKQGVAWVDIGPAYSKTTSDASLTAGDGLHPAAGMYSLWVQALAPVVLDNLK